METYKIIVLSIGIPLLFIDFYFMFRYLGKDIKLIKIFKRNELPNLNKQYKKKQKQNKKENSWTFE